MVQEVFEKSKEDPACHGLIVIKITEKGAALSVEGSFSPFEFDQLANTISGLAGDKNEPDLSSMLGDILKGDPEHGILDFETFSKRFDEAMSKGQSEEEFFAELRNERLAAGLPK